LRIRTKLFLALSILALLPLISFVLILSLGIRSLEENIERSLTNESKDDLRHLAKDQAAISNAMFDRIAAETNIMSRFASVLWSNSPSFGYRRSYSSKEKPNSIYSTSAYTLAPGVSINTVRKELELSSNMDDIFITVGTSDGNLESIYIGTESGIFREYPWKQWNSEVDDRYNPKTRDWYQKAVKEGKTVWTKYVDWPKSGDATETEYIFTCSSPVYTSKGNLVGVVGADIALKTISEKIIKTPEEVEGYAFLVNEDGEVIDQEAEVKSFVDLQKESKIIRNMTNGRTGLEFDGTYRNYIAYVPIPSRKWSMGIVMPVEEILKPAADAKSTIDRVRNVLIGILLVMIFAVSGVAYRLSRRITEPILDLDEGARIVGSGNLDYQLEVRTGDEIEDLANAFSKMTSDLKAYMKDLEKTTAARERIQSELRIASEIQASMLPRTFPPFPDRKEFDIFATMEPAKEVGGDFYDFFFIDEDKLCFLIGDVSGKGVPAALFMAISRILLKTEALRGIPPDKILYNVNNTLCPDNDASMFVTLFCVILDTETGEIQFANAGHNPPLLCSNGGGTDFMQLLKSFVVGPMPDIEYRSQQMILEQDDVIFLYTDGVTEAMNPRKELFSEDRLKQCLSRLKDKSVQDIIDGVRTEIRDFAQGASQSDDITMLALRFNGQ
jgi:sigma-B regulation protein RsbU (phosphoserine phosphatase)